MRNVFIKCSYKSDKNKSNKNSDLGNICAIREYLLFQFFLIKTKANSK